MENIFFDSASFKDPLGRVIHRSFNNEEKIYRGIFKEEAEAFLLMLKKIEIWPESLKEKIIDFKVSHPNQLPKEFSDWCAASDISLIVEHPKIPFLSSPREWCFEQLRATAVFALELQLDLLKEGYSLKDAKASNFYMNRGRIKLLDFGSLEVHKEGTHWIAWNEFSENFTNPLMLSSLLKVPHQVFAENDNGKIPTTIAQRLLHTSHFASTNAWKYFKLPSFLQKFNSRKSDLTQLNAKLPHYFLVNSLKALRDDLQKLKAPTSHVNWEDYAKNCHYSGEDRATKHAFVRECLNSLSYKNRAIDLGANEGEYTQILIEQFDQVIAVESDPVCCNQNFLKSHSQTSVDLQVIQMNFANPTPASGWRSSERKSFLERCGRFDFALFLAVLHHVRISEQIPLAMILKLLSEITQFTVLEYVPPSDELFRQIQNGRSIEIYRDMEVAAFMKELQIKFRIIRSLKLQNHRELFFLESKL